jgi:hypothetical protein
MLAQQPEEGELLPIPNPVFEKKKDWHFDGQGNLHFNKKSPNKDGTYWIRWKQHRWMIGDEQVLIRGFDGLCLSVYLDRRSERDTEGDLSDREAMQMLLDYAHEEYKAKNLAKGDGMGQNHWMMEEGG